LEENNNDRRFFYPDSERLFYPEDDLPYKNWEGIMSVVEKIKKFNTDGKRYSTVITIVNSYTKIFVPKQELMLSSFETTKYSDDMLQNTFEACVEFVKWYNEEYN
jgi:hypothetical protein